MADFIDTSVLVAAMVGSEPNHDACRRLVATGKMKMFSHGLAETFATLTGGRKAFRISPKIASDLLEKSFVPKIQISSLTPIQMLHALHDSESRGARGGGLFDLLHLWAAREAKADRIYTLNLSHFEALYRPGDPEISHP